MWVVEGLRQILGRATPAGKLGDQDGLISRARANAMTFLRSGRSSAAPDAVSLNTATIL